VTPARLVGVRSTCGAIVAATVLLLAAAAPAAERTSPPAVGEVAPELHLRDQHGKPFVLHDVLKERSFVVLAFYPKAFTGG
jgi:cytochrome oxidase Cu insertion factor (SCO1/SenC/PrrC family)